VLSVMAGPMTVAQLMNSVLEAMTSASNPPHQRVVSRSASSGIDNNPATAGIAQPRYPNSAMEGNAGELAVASSVTSQNAEPAVHRRNAMASSAQPRDRSLPARQKAASVMSRSVVADAGVPVRPSHLIRYSEVSSHFTSLFRLRVMPHLHSAVLHPPNG